MDAALVGHYGCYFGCYNGCYFGWSLWMLLCEVYVHGCLVDGCLVDGGIRGIVKLLFSSANTFFCENTAVFVQTHIACW